MPPQGVYMQWPPELPPESPKKLRLLELTTRSCADVVQQQDVVPHTCTLL